MSASGTPEGVEGEEREKGAREGETNSMKGSSNERKEALSLQMALNPSLLQTVGVVICTFIMVIYTFVLSQSVRLMS